MTNWSHPRTSHWFQRESSGPVPAAYATRLRDQALARIADNYDKGRVTDAADLKARLRAAALLVGGAYDDAKGIIGDLHVDGHAKAAAKVGGALFKLKQAETELEEARELVMAERQRGA